MEHVILSLPRMAQHTIHMELKEKSNKPNTVLSAISCFPADENTGLLRKAIYAHA